LRLGEDVAQVGIYIGNGQDGRRFLHWCRHPSRTDPDARWRTLGADIVGW